MNTRRTFRLRSSAGFATVGAAIALVAVSVGVLTGLGTSKSSLNLGSGFAWLGSNTTGQVVLANGATGQGVSKLNIDGAAGKNVRVEQRDGHAVVVVDDIDGNARVLYRLDDQTLKNGSGVRVTQKERVVRGGNRSYLVNADEGKVQPIDSETLQPSGKSLTFDPPILAAADDDGRLVVVQKSKAVYSVVDGSSAGSENSIGSPGDTFEISTIGGRPTVVNRSKNEVVVFRKGAPTKVVMPSGPGELLVPESGEGKFLAVLRRDNGKGDLVLVDLEKSQAKQLPVPGDSSNFKAPLIVPEAVYLVDPQEGIAIVIDPVDGTVRARRSLEVGKGDQNTEAFVKDGYLWVNNPNDANAIVVDRDGNAKKVNKYKKDIPEINPLPADAPTKGESPSDQPPQGPVAPTGRQPVSSGPDLPLPGPQAPPPSTPPPPIVNKPSAPPNLKATAQNKAIRLTWDKTPDGGAPIDRYLLKCDPDCGKSPTTIGGAPQETLVEGLTNGKDYKFTLSAGNSAGEGPASTASAQPSADVPPAPNNVKATANPDGSVSLTWEMNAEGLKIDGFDVVAKSINPIVKPQSVSYPVSGGTTLTFKTPVSGTNALGFDDDTNPDYAFTVAARGQTKDGKPSNSQDSLESNRVDPYKAPAFATGASLVATGADGVVSLQWPAAAANGRQVRYQIDQCLRPVGAISDCAPWTAASASPTVGTASQSTTVTGLQNGTAYTFRITATNDAGNVTLLSSNVRPHRKPAVTITGSGNTGPGGIFVTFTVNWYGDNTNNCSGGSSGDCGRRDLGGLAPARQYSIDVCATNSFGEKDCQTGTAKTDGVAVTIDVITHLSGFASPGICGGYDGAGILDTPDDYYGATRLGCAQQNSVWTVDCQHVGAMITGTDGTKNNVWFHIINAVNGKSAWLSGMWISGSPTNLGVPGC